MHKRTTSTTPSPFVSVEEAALLLGEARSTLYRAVKAGTLPLPVVRIGARIRIPRIAIDRLIVGEHPSEAANRPSSRPKDSRCAWPPVDLPPTGGRCSAAPYGLSTNPAGTASDAPG